MTSHYTRSRRASLAGKWILDKSRGNWTMKEYLAVMNVDPVAIEAHEKGDLETDTIHHIEFYGTNKVKITKRSRVNNDVTYDFKLGVESVEYCQPGDRPKRMTATSDQSSYLRIESSLATMGNGVAVVTDVKTLQEGNGNIVLHQKLTIVNEETKDTHTVERYFIPYTEPETS